uniref:Sfi1 spindle body domain-containing protein n=2 Tax=Globisporangium ultimum (strain ATCC 200006 / CBS 805.95 / DAOM BR144) TaxID=431595 RepID=K3W9A2_GLOUD
MNACAESVYTQKLLRKAMTRLKRVVRNRMVVTTIRRRHSHNLQWRLVERWKRKMFAIAWSHQQLCSRKCCQKREVRLSFTHWRAICKSFAAREARFLHKKARRAVWKWFTSTRDEVKVKEIVAVVANREATRVLRDVGWTPWRAMYVWTTKKHEYETAWRHRCVQRIWMKLVDAVQQQRRKRLLHVKAMAHFSKTWMRHAFQWWLHSCAAMREKKTRKDQADRLHYVHTMKRVFLIFRQNQSSAASTKVGDMYFLRHMMKRWAQLVVSSKRLRNERIVKFAAHMRRVSMHLCIDQWRQYVIARRRKRMLWVFSKWKKILESNKVHAQLYGLACRIRKRMLWRKWVHNCQYFSRLQATAMLMAKRHEISTMKYVFMDLWLVKVVNYGMALKKLQQLAKSTVKSIIFQRWLLLRRDGVASKKALRFYEYSLKKAKFRYLQRLVADAKCRIRAWKLRCLRAHWQRWTQMAKRKGAFRNASLHWRQFHLRRALSMWQTRVDQAARSHYQCEVAISWRIAIVKQTVFSKWQLYMEQRERYRQGSRSVEWRIVGRSVWSRWRRALLQRQRIRMLQHSINCMALRRCWDAILQIVKRRQVAKSMWRYAMIRVRLSKCLHHWYQCLEQRRERHDRVMTMVKKQQQEIMKAFFAAWSQFLVVHAFRMLRESQESRRWTHRIWGAWTLHCRVQKWIRRSQRQLLWKVFIFGLKRHAFDCQAYREVRFRYEARLLLSTLTQWRVEWWLRGSQRRILRQQTQWVMAKWVGFATKRRQKRKLSAYMKQLHRFHQSSEPVKQTRRARVFQEAWILQKQADACRETKRNTFEAWTLYSEFDP